MDAAGPELAAPDADSKLKSSTTTPSSVAHSPLFKLPRELRDSIYEFSFNSLHESIETYYGEQHLIKVTKDRGIPEPALLSTCKVVRDEAVMLFYGRDRFAIVFDSYDPAAMLLWNAKTLHLNLNYNLVAPSRGALRTGGRSWDNLKRSLQLHHSGHTLSMEIYPRDSPEYREEDEFIQGMFRTARAMEEYEWEDVEEILQMLRLGLAALHYRWAR